MAKIRDGYFVPYEFTPDELREAQILSPLTRMHISTLIANYSEERAVLEVQHEFPNSLQAYALAQAKILGCIQSLQHLLALHDLAEAEYAASTLSTGS